jgi:hypothetical protein
VGRREIEVEVLRAVDISAANKPSVMDHNYPETHPTIMAVFIYEYLEITTVLYCSICGYISTISSI